MADRLGDSVIELTGVSKGYGERLLIDDLSFKVPPGAIVGVIGPNGAGKSTLFRMITGKEKADKGKIAIGPTVKMAYVDQSRDALEGEKTVWEYISDGADILTVGKFEMPSRAYLGRFNIKGADQQKKVGTLSGGERGRVHLAKTHARRAPTCCCSTSPPTTSTWRRCARSRTRCSSSPAACSSPATTAGSSTASPPTSSPSRASRR